MISSQYHVVENSRCEQSRPSSHPSRRAELDRTCKIRKTRKSDPKPRFWITRLICWCEKRAPDGISLTVLRADYVRFQLARNSRSAQVCPEVNVSIR
jgi:hypothetical protein